MDPEVALTQMRLLAAELLKIGSPARGEAREVFEADAIELAEAVQALDEWLTKGGHRPADWAPLWGST